MRISDWSSDVCSSDLFLSRMSVERRVAQLFDFVGDIDALVGHDAFEDADAFLQSFGLGRILRGLFRRFVRDRGQLPFLELQVPAIHVAADAQHDGQADDDQRSEEHTSELQSIMRLPYAVFCLKKKK